MTKCVEISYAQGEMNNKIAEVLGKMLETGVVDGIMAPVKQGAGVRQTLVTSVDALGGIDAFAPVVAVNSAKLASSLTASPSGKKVALVMRSCEIRAMVELIKLNQANFKDVLMVGTDCLGRMENIDYKSFAVAGGDSEKFIDSPEGLCSACTICEYPVASNVDLNLGVIGAGGKLIIEALTEKGEEALAANALVETPSGRTSAIETLIKEREVARDALYAKYKEEVPGFAALEERLADCVNCYNCRVACPVCYCKECVFVTDTFRHKGEQFFNWAQNSGSLQMPTDTLFYHLTRMSHISTVCIGCGQCTSACPNDIDLMPIFRMAADKAQKRFNYEAGRSVDDEQPLSIFEFDEMVEVTGQVK
ncbi:MAG: 4Fe-4S binding protein [Desulfotalea sp.]